VLERRKNERPKRIGIQGYSFDVIEETDVEVVQFWDDPGGGSEQTVTGNRYATTPTMLGVGASIPGQSAEDFS
jgi:hypothetical protein